MEFSFFLVLVSEGIQGKLFAYLADSLNRHARQIIKLAFIFVSND
jgi:hypothetical protein